MNNFHTLDFQGETSASASEPEDEALANATISCGHIGFYREDAGTIVEYFEIAGTIYKAPMPCKVDEDSGVRDGWQYVCKSGDWDLLRHAVVPGEQLWPPLPK